MSRDIEARELLYSLLYQSEQRRFRTLDENIPKEKYTECSIYKLHSKRVLIFHR